jgi:hypothetical protein
MIIITFDTKYCSCKNINLIYVFCKMYDKFKKLSKFELKYVNFISNILLNEN